MIDFKLIYYLLNKIRYSRRHYELLYFISKESRYINTSLFFFISLIKYLFFILIFYYYYLIWFWVINYYLRKITLAMNVFMHEIWWTDYFDHSLIELWSINRIWLNHNNEHIFNWSYVYNCIHFYLITLSNLLLIEWDERKLEGHQNEIGSLEEHDPNSFGSKGRPSKCKHTTRFSSVRKDDWGW